MKVGSSYLCVAVLLVTCTCLLLRQGRYYQPPSWYIMDQAAAQASSRASTVRMRNKPSGSRPRPRTMIESDAPDGARRNRGSTHNIAGPPPGETQTNSPQPHILPINVITLYRYAKCSNDICLFKWIDKVLYVVNNPRVVRVTFKYLYR